MVWLNGISTACGPRVLPEGSINIVSLLEQRTGGGDVHELAGGVCLNGSKEYGVYRLKRSIYGLKQFPQ